MNVNRYYIVYFSVKSFYPHIFNGNRLILSNFDFFGNMFYFESTIFFVINYKQHKNCVMPVPSHVTGFECLILVNVRRGGGGTQI